MSAHQAAQEIYKLHYKSLAKLFTKQKTAHKDGNLTPKVLNDTNIIPPVCQDCGIVGCPYNTAATDKEASK